MGIFRKDLPPGTSPAETVSFNTPRPLTAAAVRVKMNDKTEAELFKKRKSSTTAVWQSDGWEYYDAIGEVKYAFNLVASVVSRIRLYAAVVQDAAEAPISVNDSDNIDPDLARAATRALERLDSAYGGQAGLLKDAALNLSVAGECYLVQIPARPGQGLGESWDIRSVDELQVDADDNYFVVGRRDLNVRNAAGAPGVIQLPPKAFVGRIWRAHPRFSDEPESSMKGVLDLCSELLLINRSYRALERSRINAGILYLPDGLSNAGAPDPDFPFDDDEESPEGVAPVTPEEAEDMFEEAFMDAMITPITDEGAPSSVAPLLVRGPTELGKEIRHITFDRKFDATIEKRADRVLERILQGLDVPKDTVTGLANVKYSNAVQIDESLYKAHIEPMLLLISDALTTAYFRPYLVSLGYDEEAVNRLVIWYDPSAVATRNDRAADADAGYDKKAISSATWRRAHGFSDSDAPTPTEMALRMVFEHGSLTPETTEAILAAIAPDVMNAARDASQAASVAPVPDDVQNILDGAQGGPAGAAAEQPNADPNATQAVPLAEPSGEAPAEEDAAPAAAQAAPVEEDEEAPAIPLA